MINRPSTIRAIKHLTAFGDTDIFPRLPELRFLSDKSDEISAELEKLTVGSYSPQAATEMLVPKSTKSFRIAHQLTAMDSLIYLASVLENAPSFESVRVSSDEEVAFSYRFLEGDGPRVFRIDGSFHDWLIKLKEYGGESTATDKRMVLRPTYLISTKEFIFIA